MKHIKHLNKWLVWTFATATFSAFAQSVTLEQSQCRPEVIKRPTLVGMALSLAP